MARERHRPGDPIRGRRGLWAASLLILGLGALAEQALLSRGLPNHATSSEEELTGPMLDRLGRTSSPSDSCPPWLRSPGVQDELALQLHRLGRAFGVLRETSSTKEREEDLLAGARALSTASFALTVVLIAACGCRLFSVPGGWIAALVYMTAPLASIPSGHATAKVGGALFGAATLYQASRHLVDRRPGWILLASITAGLAAGSDYASAGFLVVPAILAARDVVSARKGLGPRPAGETLLFWLLGLTWSVFAFLLVNREILLDPTGFASWVVHTEKRHTLFRPLWEMSAASPLRRPWLFAGAVLLPVGLGWPLLALLVSGLVGLRGRRALGPVLALPLGALLLTCGAGFRSAEGGGRLLPPESILPLMGIAALLIAGSMAGGGRRTAVLARRAVLGLGMAHALGITISWGRCEPGSEVAGAEAWLRSRDPEAVAALIYDERENPGQASPWWHDAVRSRSVFQIDRELAEGVRYVVVDGCVLATPRRRCSVGPWLLGPDAEFRQVHEIRGGFWMDGLYRFLDPAVGTLFRCPGARIFEHR